MMLYLYSIFHLNLAYSSLSESRRTEVIQRCFWPLLRLATEDEIPIAIEAPGYTLEVIEDMELSWINELKNAIATRRVEFVGSGYSQLIAPLVPAGVNVWNLMNGIDAYNRLLHHRPKIWFINEQAYSRGIVEHYTQIGAKGVIMEWNNPKTLHPEWNNEFRYYPQIAVGNNGKTIPLLWNDSISFQKFQRYAHNDLSIDEMTRYLIDNIGSQNRYFCLYGNDAEIFDFRPGRFKAEPKLLKKEEWARIRDLYCRLRDDHRFKLILPSDVLRVGKTDSSLSYVPISLESAVQPIPVKKQPKYNVTRWQVTGRNSGWLNAQCYEIYRRICVARDRGVLSGKDLRKLEKVLCYFWSSDFRTHIVQDRWKLLVAQIEKTLRQLKQIIEFSAARLHTNEVPIKVNGLKGTVWARTTRRKSTTESLFEKNINIEARYVRIHTPSVDIVLNKLRGLAIESLAFPRVCPKPLIGTIKHGYFEEISLSADWYSASTVLQRPGKSQITDLEKTDPLFSSGTSKKGPWIGCIGTIATEIGRIEKRFVVYYDISQIDLEFIFEWRKIPLGSFRSGFITLLPDSFDESSLFYATHNGGFDYEVFELANQTITHGAPSSSVVTASSGLGSTEGTIVIGDNKKGFAVMLDQTMCAAMPMLTFRLVDPSFIARLMFSLGEMDESRIQEASGPLRFTYSMAGMAKRKPN